MPTALVTGAAKRIGRAIALALADEGYNIILHYGTSKKEAEQTAREIEKKGRKVITISADLTDLAQIDSLVEESLRNFKTIDLLVNNAATFHSNKLADIQDREAFRRAYYASIDSNLTGPVYLATKLGYYMKEKQKSGLIINIGDWAQVVGRPYPNHLPYHISKGGLIIATKALAVELAPEVRVNMIANGPIIPPLDYSKKEIKEVSDLTLLKKWGGEESVAEWVLNLIQASNVTGDIILNDGGRHLIPG